MFARRLDARVARHASAGVTCRAYSPSERMASRRVRLSCDATARGPSWFQPPSCGGTRRTNADASFVFSGEASQLPGDVMQLESRLLAFEADGRMNKQRLTRSFANDIYPLHALIDASLFNYEYIYLSLIYLEFVAEIRRDDA